MQTRCNAIFRAVLRQYCYQKYHARQPGQSCRISQYPGQHPPQFLHSLFVVFLLRFFRVCAIPAILQDTDCPAGPGTHGCAKKPPRFQPFVSYRWRCYAAICHAAGAVVCITNGDHIWSKAFRALANPVELQSALGERVEKTGSPQDLMFCCAARFGCRKENTPNEEFIRQGAARGWTTSPPRPKQRGWRWRANSQAITLLRVFTYGYMKIYLPRGKHLRRRQCAPRVMVRCRVSTRCSPSGQF